MIQLIKSVFSKKNKNDSLQKVEQLLIYLDEVIGLQERHFQHLQLQVVQNAVKSFNAATYNKHFSPEQALIIFKESIFEQIEAHKQPHYFQGLKRAIEDF